MLVIDHGFESLISPHYDPWIAENIFTGFQKMVASTTHASFGFPSPYSCHLQCVKPHLRTVHILQMCHIIPIIMAQRCLEYAITRNQPQYQSGTIHTSVPWHKARHNITETIEFCIPRAPSPCCRGACIGIRQGV